MAEDSLARRHRMARQHLRSDQAFRRRQDRLAGAMARKRLEIGRLSSNIERLTRDERSAERGDLLERIGTAKTEALRRINDLPWYALEKDDWHQEVERIRPTAADAPQALTAIQERVKRCRTASEPLPIDPAPARLGPLEAAWGLRPAAVAVVRNAALCDPAQQAQLTVALLLIEIQLDKLIELSRDWQSA